MKKIKKIYIAGPLTPRGKRKDTNNVAIEYLFNVNDMIDIAIQLIKCGFTPFTPGIDFAYFLHPSAPKVLTEDKIKELSLDWMEACDALLVLPRHESSVGALKEIVRAKELAIPIFYGIGPIMEYNAKID